MILRCERWEKDLSPAGSTDGTEHEEQLILKPAVTKTFIKGIILIGVFSIFLNISSHLVNYFIFLAIALSALGLFMLFKRASTFKIGESNIVVKRFLRTPATIDYLDIKDMAVSQGMFARRFDCGSVYMILRRGKGGVDLMSGGIVQSLDDVPKPNYVYDLISSRLSPFSGSPPSP